MSQKKLLSIKEFSRLTGIKRENLRFYDRIGLLCPEARGENNYRYYSRRQLDAAYLILSLRGLGVGIEDIKQYAARRTPENTLALFAQQDRRIREEMRRLREMRLILRLHSGMVREALERGESAPFLQEKRPEPLFLCPPSPPGLEGDERELFPYDYAEAHGVNLGFPQGTLIPRERLSSPDASQPERCYFKLGGGGNAAKPAGLYAVAYGRCEIWEPAPVYLRLFRFIRRQGLRVCGDAYEEYPLGEMAQPGTQQAFLRLEVPVAPL